MGMNKEGIDLNINELVIDGFTGVRSGELAGAIEHELGRIVSEQGESALAGHEGSIAQHIANTLGPKL